MLQIISIDPQEPKDIEALQQCLNEGYKLLASSAAHDRIVYVLLKA